MKKIWTVVPAVLVMVMLASQVAYALPLWLIPIGLSLINKATETKTVTSDVGFDISASMMLNGEHKQSVFSLKATAVVVPQIPGQRSELALDPYLNIDPSLTDGIYEMRVSSLRDGETVYKTCTRPGRRGDPPIVEKIAPKLDINSMRPGLHCFDVSAFFRNGKNKRAGAPMRIFVVVTSYDEIQRGINSPVIQEYLKLSSGGWSTTPAVGNTEYNLTDDTARRTGLADQAVAAGIPANGATETTVIGSEQAQVTSSGNGSRDKLMMYARTAGMSPKDLFCHEEISCEPGPRGIPFVAAFLDQNNNLVQVPASVIITDVGGRTYPGITSKTGDGVIAVTGLRGGETLHIEVGGQDTGALKVCAGRGYWLVIKPGGN